MTPNSRIRSRIYYLVRGTDPRIPIRTYQHVTYPQHCLGEGGRGSAKSTTDARERECREKDGDGGGGLRGLSRAG